MKKDSLKKYILLEGKSEDVLPTLPENFCQTMITSPPYWALRDYFNKDQLGQEGSPEEFVEHLVSIFREAKRVLRDDGTLWLNIGDSYNNSSGFCRATNGWGRKGRSKGSADKVAVKHPYIKKKELFGVPWMLAVAMQKDGWYLRCDIIWEKTNPMPDGAKDRPTHGHEYLFLFSQKPKYFYDYYGVLEETKEKPQQVQSFGARNQKGTFRMDQDRTFEHYGRRNRRSVWRTAVSSFQGDHFATYPVKLILPCILASTSEAGCCVKCGTAWTRGYEKEKVPADNKKGYEMRLVDKGFSKACKCKTKDTRPCIVMDPFSGMATTGIGALNEGRYYAGIELNPDYLKKSNERINTPFDMFKVREKDPKEMLL